MYTLFFFFKQKTAYEVRISDWSSDVCSSDLMFDRRKVAMTGLGFASAAGIGLTAIAVLGLTTPWTLLLFCSLIGAGVALYSPAWQSSIIEQVHIDRLPAAVALGAVSYNIARSFGPAIGGLVVVAIGAKDRKSTRLNSSH